MLRENWAPDLVIIALVVECAITYHLRFLALASPQQEGLQMIRFVC